MPEKFGVYINYAALVIFDAAGYRKLMVFARWDNYYLKGLERLTSVIDCELYRPTKKQIYFIVVVKHFSVYVGLSLGVFEFYMLAVTAFLHKDHRGLGFKPAFLPCSPRKLILSQLCKKCNIFCKKLNLLIIILWYNQNTVQSLDLKIIV